eukprot:COSAG04_NODE_3631_length_2659_cov_2.003516_3_plen_194_part_00
MPRPWPTAVTLVARAQANQEVLSRLPESTDEEMEAAVAAAEAAFPAWWAQRPSPLPCRGDPRPAPAAALAAPYAGRCACRSETSVSVRARIMFKLQQLIREHTDELADAITLELGKVTADAKGDVFRGLEVVEQCCGMSAPPPPPPRALDAALARPPACLASLTEVAHGGAWAGRRRCWATPSRTSRPTWTRS